MNKRTTSLPDEQSDYIDSLVAGGSFASASEVVRAGLCALKERDVVFSPEAKQDLLDLYNWIADAGSPPTALDQVERLERYCRGFEFASERGYRRDDVREGLRIVGVERSATIAFAVEEERVTVLRLYYGGRDWEEEVD